jgi:hypothetical protein
MKLTYKQYQIIRTKDFGPEHELVPFIWILHAPGNKERLWAESWHRLARKKGIFLEEFSDGRDNWIIGDSTYWLSNEHNGFKPAEHYEDYAVI